MNIIYWSPHLSEKIATVKAVLYSAISISKFSNKQRKTFIINAIGEWYSKEDELKKNNVEMINFIASSNLYKNLPRDSYFKSRCSYIFIYLYCFLKLLNFLKKKEPEYFIFHLISSLPLTLLILFNFKTRFILRISGLPKMNFLRKFLWKMSSQKIYKVICPTEATYLDLLNNGIFEKGKLCIVNDPVLVSSEIVKNKSKFFDTDKIVEANKNKFILGIGRLSKQKNFNFLIKNFVDIKKKYPFLKLIILGEGEESYQGRRSTDPH